MSRRNKKKKKGNQLQTFKTRGTCPECSSGKVTMLNKSRHILKCLSCEHKFIYDNGVYDTLISKTEHKEIQEEKDIIVAKPVHKAPPRDPLSDFFSSLCK